MDYEKGKRIEWIDIAKGLTMLLVILGHSVNGNLYGNITRGIIFSFHMPLFFIVSCITYKFSNDEHDLIVNLKKSIKHLLLPAVIIYLILIVYQTINDTSLLFDVYFLRKSLYILIFSSGIDLNYYGINAPAIGIPWFFFALFIGRFIFDFSHLNIKDNKKLLIFSITTGLIGVLWGQVQEAPFSIDIALAIQPFFYAGYFIKNSLDNQFTYKKVFFYLIVWLSTLYLTFPEHYSRSYLELAARRYSLFPISYISAIAGTMFVFGICYYLSKLSIFRKSFGYIGKNSLYLLCIHALDEIYMSLWLLNNHQFFTSFKRIAIDLLLFFVFKFTKLLIKKVKQHRRAIQ